ncbi:MAG: serine/threonine protein phosphatase PrpC [Mariniblastus sp.]|jgi:serine/threonine protein phosphatase PrpC
MVINAAARTDIGLVRSKNEDFFYVDSEKGLFIVCDGLGGHVSGDVASSKAIEFAVDYLESQWKWIHSINSKVEPLDGFSLNQLVERTIQDTGERLIELGKSSPLFSGMATTMTLLLIVDDTAVVGHVGDSRLYLRQGEVATQLTCDHTLYADFVKDNPDWISENTDLDAIKRFQQVLTRCIGRKEKITVETFTFEPRNGDVLLLCTDGLSNYFEDETEIADLLQGNDVNEVAEGLIRFANECGGRDNITAVVMRIANVDDFVVRPQRIQIDLEDTGEYDFGC